MTTPEQVKPFKVVYFDDDVDYVVSFDVKGVLLDILDVRDDDPDIIESVQPVTWAEFEEKTGEKKSDHI